MGLEALNLDEARLKELGLSGFAHPMKVTCDDHAGSHPVFIQEWDGTQWRQASGWIEPMTDIVRPLLEAAAAEYAEKNAPWPAAHRTLPELIRQSAPPRTLRGGASQERVEWHCWM